MTRVIRLILPVSLCGLFTSAAFLACHHNNKAPATAPSQAPAAEPQAAPTPPPAGEQPTPGGPRPDVLDAGMTAPPQSLQHSLNSAGAPSVQLASQPTTPSGPTGAPPTPGAPAPNPPTPSPSAPSPSTPAPGTGSSPSTPPSPTGPSQPGAPTPAPGTPQTPSTPTQAPGDAGVGDALTPPVPSISDAGVRIDSAMSPVLQRGPSGPR